MSARRRRRRGRRRGRRSSRTRRWDCRNRTGCRGLRRCGRGGTRRRCRRLRDGWRRRRDGRRRTRGGPLRRSCLCLLLRFGRSFLRRQSPKILSRKLRVFEIERARVRLLFGDADFRQEIDQDFRFDLEFARQLVNSNLIGICHQPLFFSKTSQYPPISQRHLLNPNQFLRRRLPLSQPLQRLRLRLLWHPPATPLREFLCLPPSRNYRQSLPMRCSRRNLPRSLPLPQRRFHPPLLLRPQRARLQDQQRLVLQVPRNTAPRIGESSPPSFRRFQESRPIARASCPPASQSK